MMLEIEAYQYLGLGFLLGFVPMALLHCWSEWEHKQYRKLYRFEER